MKTKTTNDHSIHQRVEHFFRSRACVAFILGFMALAIFKTDSKLIGMMRDMYAQGFGMIGMYMREETARTPVNFGTNVRIATISGR
jgi:hypothetical protein